MEIGMAVLWTVKSRSPIWSGNSTLGHAPKRTDSRVSHTPVFIVASFTTWRLSLGCGWPASHSILTWCKEDGRAPLSLFSGPAFFRAPLLLSRVWLFVTPWTAACQTSLSFTTSWSLLTLSSIESVMPSNHLILCHPLLLLPSIFPSIRVFSNESAPLIRWPKYWSFSFSISLSNGYSGSISFIYIFFLFFNFL